MTSIKSCGAERNSSIQSILNKNSDNHIRENALMFCSFYIKRYEIIVIWISGQNIHSKHRKIYSKIVLDS